MDKYSLIYSKKILSKKYFFLKLNPLSKPHFPCGLWCQTDFMYKIQLYDISQGTCWSMLGYLQLPFYSHKTIKKGDTAPCTSTQCGQNISKLCNFMRKRYHPFSLYGTIHLRRRHSLLWGRGGGVKNLPNLQTGSSKKMPMEGGRGQKLGQFADILNGWSLCFQKGGIPQ